MGPMVAGNRFLNSLRTLETPPAQLRASLHGSLAFTGKGHASDRATILGLAGFLPDTYDHVAAEETLSRIAADKEITVEGLPPMRFDPDHDLLFDYDQILRGHANGMKLIALDENGAEVAREIFYSIGGGFVLTASELEAEKGQKEDQKALSVIPYPFETADQMLAMAAESGKCIASMKFENEAASCRSQAELTAGIDRIWQVMKDCMDRGLERDGHLPGGLNVKVAANTIAS